MDANVTPITPTNAAAERAAAEAAGGPLSRLALMPLRARMMLGMGMAGLTAVLVGLLLWNGNGNLAPLYPNLSDKDAAAVMTQLAALKVPYKAAGDGTMLLVPAAQVPELRLKLAQAGLPKGTTAGFELLDNARFGQSQLQERTNLQRALEGELVRSITSIAAVQSARVHLALPQQNGFFREQQKPSASVLVTLHAGRALERSQVAGIVHLVSSSVPELAVKSVSVIDQNGALLSSPPEANHQGLDTQQLQYLQQVESGLHQRVVGILEPVLGRDNLRATVTAELDFTQVESTSEAYKPNQTGEATVRSQRSSEATNATTNTPAGVPGAASNQPGQPATAPLQANGAAPLQAAQPSGAGGGARKENTVNYEVDKTVSMRRQAIGTVKRLNAAVLVNHRSTTDAKGKTTTTPLSAEELDKLTALVQESIGYSKDRGDSVRVVNIPFRVEAPAKLEEVPLWQQTWVTDLVRAGAVPIGAAFVALMLVFGAIRPALKRIQPPPAPPKLDAVVGDAERLPAPVEAVPAQPVEPAKAQLQLEGARGLARQNPAAVANIVRGWVSGEVA